jgi:Protein of unknown function (DUF2851)
VAEAGGAPGRVSHQRRVRVLYPGRAGTAAGPDFRNALLEIEGAGLVQGDVEIHLRQQDWEAHGHHNDPNYNGVVLHAALEVIPEATNLQSGQQAPVISLVSLLADEELPATASGSTLWEILERRGYARPRTRAEMGNLLDRAGDARFLSKSSRFQKFLQEQTAEQCLYESLLEALGYQHNQQPFLTLAGRAPYYALERAVRGIPQERWAGAIEPWLMKLSGLLTPEQASSISLPRTGFGAPMSGQEWRCFRIRPANHPRRRIAGAARLIARFLGTGLAAGLGRRADTGKHQELTSALVVTSESDGGTAYIGAARARDLAVNVALPFLHGQAVREEKPVKAQLYLGLYRNYGKLQDNELTREMTDQLMEPGWSMVLTNARRQQGLIHLHRVLAGAS